MATTTFKPSQRLQHAEAAHNATKTGIAKLEDSLAKIKMLHISPETYWIAKKGRSAELETSVAKYQHNELRVAYDHLEKKYLASRKSEFLLKGEKKALERQVDELNQPITKQQEMKDKAKEQEFKELRETLALVCKESEGLSRKLSLARQEQDGSNSQIDVLKTQVRSLLADLDNSVPRYVHEKKLESAQNNSATLNRQLDITRTELDQTKMNNNWLISQYEVACHQANTNVFNLTVKVNEAETKIKVAESRAKDLEQTADVVSGELAAANVEIEQLRTDKERLTQEVEEARDEAVAQANGNSSRRHSVGSPTSIDFVTLEKIRSSSSSTESSTNAKAITTTEAELRAALARTQEENRKLAGAVKDAKSMTCTRKPGCVSCRYHLTRAMRIARSAEHAANELVDKASFERMKAWDELQEYKLTAAYKSMVNSETNQWVKNQAELTGAKRHGKDEFQDEDQVLKVSQYTFDSDHEQDTRRTSASSNSADRSSATTGSKIHTFSTPLSATQSSATMKESDQDLRSTGGSDENEDDNDENEDSEEDSDEESVVFILESPYADFKIAQMSKRASPSPDDMQVDSFARTHTQRSAFAAKALPINVSSATAPATTDYTTFATKEPAGTTGMVEVADTIQEITKTLNEAPEVPDMIQEINTTHKNAFEVSNVPDAIQDTTTTLEEAPDAPSMIQGITTAFSEAPEVKGGEYADVVASIETTEEKAVEPKDEPKDAQPISKPQQRQPRNNAAFSGAYGFAKRNFLKDLTGLKPPAPRRNARLSARQ